MFISSRPGGYTHNDAHAACATIKGFEDRGVARVIAELDSALIDIRAALGAVSAWRSERGEGNCGPFGKRQKSFTALSPVAMWPAFGQKRLRIESHSIRRSRK